MKPGRELDALIAKKVMGFIHPELHLPVLCEICQPEHYSTDIATAWEVVDAIRYNHGGGCLGLYRNGDETWWASFNGEDAPGETGESAPHAICMAALAAIGVQE